MGHTRLGKLPKKRRWRDVIALIANGADIARVAEATNTAADAAFAAIHNNEGFKDAVHLMTQIAIAASQNDPKAHLAAAGIALPSDASAVDVAVAVSAALEKRSQDMGHRSDFGAISRAALVSAVTSFIGDREPTLFASNHEDVSAALGSLKKEANFGDLSRRFFGNLTKEYIDYFASKTLASHVGEGQRFATTNQMANFQDALDTHCFETAKIVEQYSSDWFSKNRFEGNNDISKHKSHKFAWFSLTKMRAELKVQGSRDAT